MNTATLIIKGDMTMLNEYINSERNNRYAAAKIKKEETERVAWECKAQKIPKYTKKVQVFYTFHTNNNRVDEDNKLLFCKWINDGLVLAGCVQSDSRRWFHIAGLEFKDKGNESKIEVSISELEQVGI